MIALVDDLPLVEFSGGTIFAFREEWLHDNLLRAAAQAGYPNWWLADHVTQSVTYYLSSQFSAPVVGVERLAETVQSVLQAIGYAEVGECFRALRPVREIALGQLAVASTGCELVFFEELRTRIHAEMDGGAGRLVLTELARCCKLLEGVKHFTRDCAALRDEIISYAGECARLDSAGKNVCLTIR